MDSQNDFRISCLESWVHNKSLAVLNQQVIMLKWTRISWSKSIFGHLIGGGKSIKAPFSVAASNISPSLTKVRKKNNLQSFTIHFHSYYGQYQAIYITNLLPNSVLKEVSQLLSLKFKQVYQNMMSRQRWKKQSLYYSQRSNDLQNSLNFIK